MVVRATAAWRHHRLMRAWLRRVTVFAAAAVLTERSRHVRRQSASALEAYGLQRSSRTEPAVTEETKRRRHAAWAGTWLLCVGVRRRRDRRA